MDRYIFFIILMIIVYLIWTIPYLYKALKWKVIIHPFTWWVWLILIWINLYWLYLSDNSSIAILWITIRFICILMWTILWIIFIRKLKITLFDYFCLILSLLSLLILNIFWIKEAIISTIIIELIVISPTIKKIYLNPYTDSESIWFLTMLSQIFLILSINNITFENSAFWIFTMFENFFIMIYIIIRKVLFKKSLD